MAKLARFAFVKPGSRVQISEAAFFATNSYQSQRFARRTAALLGGSLHLSCLRSTPVRESNNFPSASPARRYGESAGIRAPKSIEKEIDESCQTNWSRSDDSADVPVAISIFPTPDSSQFRDAN